MTIRRRARHILLLVALATGSSAVYAVPIEVGLGAFGPGAITIDFDAYPEGPVPVVPGITITGRPGEIGIHDGSR